MEYGDLMLSSMLQRACDEGNVRPAGSVITTGNIEAHITRLRTEMLHYKDRHGPVIERLRGLRSEYAF
jgi:hypothetical protein